MASTARRWTLGVTALALATTLAVPPTAGAGDPDSRKRLYAVMDGLQETSGGDANGEGFAIVDLKKRKREVCYSINWLDVQEPITAAHIHKGRTGVSGPPKVTLWSQPATGGEQADCVEDVGRKLIAKLRDNTRRYYVNLHNGEFPDGAIRGQLQQKPPPICSRTCWPPEPPRK